MSIIDVHIHASTRQRFRDHALRIGHGSSLEDVRRLFRESGIALAVAMGSGHGAVMEGCEPLTAGLADENDQSVLPPFIGYCVGLRSGTLSAGNVDEVLCAFESHLKQPNCLGIKMYPGYNPVYPNDALHQGFFKLAAHYDVPVVFHTGDTANPLAHVRYAHPLGVDDAAVAHPDVRFIMAHYGNPWIVDATEVAKKNPNVFVDLSGLAQGCFDVDWFFDTYAGYVAHLRTWMAYLSDYTKLMYGSDFPLCHIPTYIALMRRLVPESAHQAVFHDNALAVFTRLKNCTPLTAE